MVTNFLLWVPRQLSLLFFTNLLLNQNNLLSDNNSFIVHARKRSRRFRRGLFVSEVCCKSRLFSLKAWDVAWVSAASQFRSLFINETFSLQPNISCQCNRKQENRIYFEWNRSLVRRMYIKGPSPLIRPRGIITNSHFWTYSTILSCPLHYSS